MTPAQRERRRQQEAKADENRAQADERFWSRWKARWEERLGETFGMLAEDGDEQKFRETLAKILELLGSDNPGERDNAARMAHEAVRKSGRPWNYWLGVD